MTPNFHQVNAVLHEPVYREKYAQLQARLPTVRPCAGGLLCGAGKALMDLHLGYEAIEPWPLQRSDRAPVVGGASAPTSAAMSPVGAEAPPTRAVAASAAPAKAADATAAPKAMLKADKTAGTIALDADTTLSGIPPETWDYKLGNRSALEWILDQYKESKPRDPTIREKFNTYRFADYKEHVVDLLMRVTRVSVETRRSSQR